MKEIVRKRKRPEEVRVDAVESVERRLRRAAGWYEKCASVTFNGAEVARLLGSWATELQNAVAEFVEAGSDGGKEGTP